MRNLRRASSGACHLQALRYVFYFIRCLANPSFVSAGTDFSAVGNVFEKRLIEKWIEENGKDPITGDDLTIDDLMPVKTARVVRPRPPTLTSIPALLSTFQNEWDSMALESFNLREQLQRTREELSTALYQNDAAVRVIARLSRERDEARNALSKVSVSNGNNAGAAQAGADSMAIDSDVLPTEMVEVVEETQKSLSKSRKKRPIPEGTATSADISSYAVQEDFASPVVDMSTFSYKDGLAAIAGQTGTVCVYEPAQANVKFALSLQEPVTTSTWVDNKSVLATASGAVKVFVEGEMIASFSEHAGPVTGLAVHPSRQILASVGSDKSIVFYDLQGNKRAARIFTDSGKSKANLYSISLSSRPLTFGTSFDNLRVPSRWSSFRCRHRVRRDQGLHDGYMRASYFLLAGCARTRYCLLGKRILVRCSG